MLIVSDEQRLRAGIGSLSKRCQNCSKALAAYPLILSGDGRLAVYHVPFGGRQLEKDQHWHPAFCFPSSNSRWARPASSRPLPFFIAFVFLVLVVHRLQVLLLSLVQISPGHSGL